MGVLPEIAQKDKENILTKTIGYDVKCVMGTPILLNTL